MKTFRDYLSESEAAFNTPVTGDDFAIVIREECLIESYVVDTVADGVVIAGDSRLLDLLESYGYTTETIRRYGAVGSSPGMGYTVGEDKIDETDHDDSDQELRLIRGRAGLEETAPYQPETDADHNDPLAAKAAADAAVGPMEQKPINEILPAIGAAVGGAIAKSAGAGAIGQAAGRIGGSAVVSSLTNKEVEEDGVDPVNAQGQDAEDLHGQATSSVAGAIDEAEYQGREVKLGKPFLTPGGPKKRSVYVKNPKGNIVKVNFGDPNMRIKKSNPERRKSFRARHNCDNPGPRHKARYWSCRAW